MQEVNHFHTKDVKTLFQEFHTSEKGLAKEEAEKRLTQYGRNEISKEKKTPEEYALDAQKMNERLSPWIYVIPKWQHEAFITDLDQLLEKPDRKKTKKD